MVGTLSANICMLRKASSMTQEQLAEALGVTFAAVSKWERSVATPDLSLIVRMADLFGVSLDTLIGFEVKNHSVDAFEKRIRDLRCKKQYEEAIAEAENALLRYPNDFRVVHGSGELYAAAGVERDNESYLHRCITLLERSILLLSQNSDPEINEISIQTVIAQSHILLRQAEKGIEILKKYNVYGVHNALIALAYTGNDITYTNTTGLDMENAVPYMVDAFGDIITAASRTMMAYANYYYKTGDYVSGRDALLWLIQFLESIKRDKQAVAYLDKMIAPCYCECAGLSLLLGETDKVKPYLHHTYETAKRFDANPTYGIRNIKFYIGSGDDTVSYDDLGESAITAVEKQLTLKKYDRSLYEMWTQIVSNSSKEELP